MAQFFTWRKGSTFRMYFDVTSGDVTGEEPVRCAMKQRRFGEAYGDELVVFVVEFFPAADGAYAYFEISAEADEADSLPLGDYLADLRIEFDDGEFQSDPIRIQLLDRVTEDA